MKITKTYDLDTENAFALEGYLEYHYHLHYIHRYDFDKGLAYIKEYHTKEYMFVFDLSDDYKYDMHRVNEWYINKIKELENVN